MSSTGQNITMPFYYWKSNNNLTTLSFETSKNCSGIIWVYKISTIPKIIATEKIYDEYISYIVKQKVFIESLCATVISSQTFLRGAFEIRLENNPSLKLINTYIILKLSILEGRDERDFDLENYKQQFESLFPAEYEISEINGKAEKDRILLLNGKNVYEIIKTPRFLHTGKIFSNTQIANPNTEINSNSSLRIPCVSTIQPNISDLVNFYRVLQACEEQVMIRFSIGLAEIYDIEKNIASFYQKLLSTTYTHPDSELENFIMTFAKYRNAENLYSLKIQVACNNILKAKSVANTFCGQLSNTGLSSSTVYKSFSLEDHKERDNDWSFCNHYHFNFWKDANAHSTEMMSFMRRLPYLYNNIEFLVPFRIPISLPEGIPGMVTKPIKPFYQPNPTTEEKEGGSINLGKIIGSSQKEQEQLDYHIPIQDLTKHGLIVGTTGSGKTNTTLNFVKSLTEKKIPFLIIEPVKSEYYDELKDYFESKNITLKRFNFKNPFLDNGHCNPEFLRFNPLFPLNSVSEKTNSKISLLQHIGYIKGCFNAAFPMYGIMPLVLEECLYDLFFQIWNSDEKKLFNSEFTPSHIYGKPYNDLNEHEKELFQFLNIDHLLSRIDIHLSDTEKYSEDERKEMGNILRRRINKLTKGLLGNCLCPNLWINSSSETLIPEDISKQLSKSALNELNQLKTKLGDEYWPSSWQNTTEENAIIPNIATLLNEPTIIELEHLSDNEDKALIMAFLLTYLFELKQTEKSTKQMQNEQGVEFDFCKNTHVTIIEEAHRLLSSSSFTNVGGDENSSVTQDSKSKSISLFIDMLAEIRSKGEGIFIVEQIPTKLIPDAIKNTNLKIMHRLPSKDDREYLGAAMNMSNSQKEYVTNLKRGEAIIFDETLDYPIFLNIKKYKPNETGR